MLFFSPSRLTQPPECVNLRMWAHLSSTHAQWEEDYLFWHFSVVEVIAEIRGYFLHTHKKKNILKFNWLNVDVDRHSDASISMTTTNVYWQ